MYKTVRFTRLVRETMVEAVDVEVPIDWELDADTDLDAMLCRHEAFTLEGVDFDALDDWQYEGEVTAGRTDPSTSPWEDRHVALCRSMKGFTGLISAIQGFLVGYSLAAGEIWETPDVATTLALAEGLLWDTTSMVEAFGLEQ